MASVQGGPFFPAPTESRILSQLQCGVPVDHIIKSQVFIFICYINWFIIEEFYVHSLGCTILLDFRIFVHAENNFNHIKEGFLGYQRRNNFSVSSKQAIRCTCSFTGFNQPFCSQLNICPYLLSSCKVLFYFITVITIIVEFLNFNIYSPPHFENNSMKISKKSTFITVILIVFFLVDQWTELYFQDRKSFTTTSLFSNSFFTVDGCIECVKGILNS